LIAATVADDLMVTSAIHDDAARKRSYELLAGAFGMAPLDRSCGSEPSRIDVSRNSRGTRACTRGFAVGT
jgi:hypothetical protein